MQETSPKSLNQQEISSAILHTVAFFSLYDLPVNLIQIHQLLYKTFSDFENVAAATKKLVLDGKLVEKDGLFSLKSWDLDRLNQNKIEIAKRWKKVNRYFWILSIIPFNHQISIINSLAMGNAHQESDIDFFVITKPKRLYFSRTIIIILFRLLGVYKTRKHINERFCFGFYITSDRLGLEKVLLPARHASGFAVADGPDDDPHFAFWFAQFLPLVNKKGYEQLILANPWIYTYFPNYDPDLRLTNLKNKNVILRVIKGSLEIICYIPALIFEPILRKIHIKHTFDLPENHWPTSTTVANDHMLKLHALDPRKDVRDRFYQLLQSLQ